MSVTMTVDVLAPKSVMLGRQCRRAPLEPGEQYGRPVRPGTRRAQRRATRSAERQAFRRVVRVEIGQ